MHTIQQMQLASNKSEYLKRGKDDGKGGPDLALPGVQPDPQAPAGMDAITQALATALRGNG